MAAIRGRAGLSLFGIGALDPAFPGYVGYLFSKPCENNHWATQKVTVRRMPIA
jgi:hypothetical protein